MQILVQKKTIHNSMLTSQNQFKCVMKNVIYNNNNYFFIFKEIEIIELK